MPSVARIDDKRRISAHVSRRVCPAPPDVRCEPRRTIRLAINICRLAFIMLVVVFEIALNHLYCDIDWRHSLYSALLISTSGRRVLLMKRTRNTRALQTLPFTYTWLIIRIQGSYIRRSLQVHLRTSIHLGVCFTLLCTDHVCCFREPGIIVVLDDFLVYQGAAYFLMKQTALPECLRSVPVEVLEVFTKAESIGWTCACGPVAHDRDGCAVLN